MSKTQEPSQEQLLLQEAANEIKQLRRKNELMSARLDMFDSCMMMLKTAPFYPAYGGAEDLVYKIETHLQDTTKPNEP